MRYYPHSFGMKKEPGSVERSLGHAHWLVRQAAGALTAWEDGRPCKDPVDGEAQAAIAKLRRWLEARQSTARRERLREHGQAQLDGLLTDAYSLFDHVFRMLDEGEHRDDRGLAGLRGMVSGVMAEAKRLGARVQDDEENDEALSE